MELKLKRIAKKSNYTIGRLYINGDRFCDTLEDKDRGLKSTMSLEEIKRLKLVNETAIPTGIYKVTLGVVSPRFSTKPFYQSNANGGRLPRLLNVKGYEGVLIHVGSNANNSSGCILVGKNKVVGGLTESKETFCKLYKVLHDANINGEAISITIE